MFRYNEEVIWQIKNNWREKQKIKLDKNGKIDINDTL